MASLGFIGPPLIPKHPGPPLIYLVGLLPISDPHINICVGPPNTCTALKQFNLLPPNTHCFGEISFIIHIGLSLSKFAVSNSCTLAVP